ncbi:hypothetical protein D3C83_228450 [compost metagenome]
MNFSFKASTSGFSFRIAIVVLMDLNVSGNSSVRRPIVIRMMATPQLPNVTWSWR